MKTASVASSILLAGALVTMSAQSAGAEPAPSSAPQAALATDNQHRISMAITGGTIKDIDGALTVVDTHGAKMSVLPGAVADDIGRTATVNYQLIGDSQAIITANPAAAPIAAAPNSGSAAAPPSFRSTVTPGARSR